MRCSMKYDSGVKLCKRQKKDVCFVPSAHFYLNFSTSIVLSRLYVTLSIQTNYITFMRMFQLLLSCLLRFSLTFYPSSLLDMVLGVGRSVVNVLHCTLDFCFVKKTLKQPGSINVAIIFEYINQNRELHYLHRQRSQARR